MGAITDLWKSERGLLAVILIIAATVLTALSHMTVDAWRDFALYIFSVYVAGKTVTGAVGLWKGEATEAAPAAAPAAAAPAAAAPAAAAPAAPAATPAEPQ